MATTITIQVGALTVNKSYQDDVRAGAILHQFYEAYNLGPVEATNRQKLEAILKWFTDTVQDKAKLRHIEVSRLVAEQEAREQFEFETPA